MAWQHYDVHISNPETGDRIEPVEASSRDAALVKLAQEGRFRRHIERLTRIPRVPDDSPLPPQQ